MPFPKTPALTTDCVVFDAKGRLLLIRRELMEETGVKAGRLELIGVYSDPKRDPRGHTCSVAFLARVARSTPKAGDDAAAAEWVEGWSRLDLAFDHAGIVGDAQRMLRS